MNQNLLFLYLNTGGGHLAPAKVVKKAIEERYPAEVSAVLLDGFSRRQHISRLFFEKGYYVACKYLPGAFSAIYDISEIPAVLAVIRSLVIWRTAKYLEKYIRANHITKIVSFHFALSPPAVRAARSVDPSIAVIVVVTDPYTAPKAWYLEKTAYYIVFSQVIKTEAIEKNGIFADHICVMPFILDKKFAPLSDTGSGAVNAVRILKRKYGIAEERKVVLIAGGGGGLPGSVPLVREFMAQKPEFSIIAVCAHDAVSQKQLEMESRRYPDTDIKIFGFVPFMDELIKLSDCVITKAGASTVMEVLSCRKPVIFSTYIHGQEQGNVRFAVENGAGWFISNPAEIYRRLCKLFSDSSLYARTASNLRQLGIHPDTDGLVRFIAEYNKYKTPDAAVSVPPCRRIRKTDRVS